MTLEKNKRWIEKDYTRWVATLPCANCGRHDETIVPHHLKHVGMEITSRMGAEVSDWAIMPLCFNCHYKLHNGDTNIKGHQFVMLYKTLDKAYNSGIMKYEKRKLFGEDLDD